MEIKIEASPELLQELHELLYANDNEIEIDEQYGPSEGYQKEAVVVGLVLTALTSITYKLITAFVKIKQAQIKADVQKDKNKLNAQKEVLKFSIKENNKWEQKCLADLAKAEKAKRSQKPTKNDQSKPSPKKSRSKD
jgi:hypothetical protein